MPSLSHSLATPRQRMPALQLLLGGTDSLAAITTVEHFIEHGPDLGRLRVLTIDDRLVWAILPVASPGRTAVLVEPNCKLPKNSEVIARDALHACCDSLFAADVQLVQCLLDPDDLALQNLHRSVGFQTLAVLEYLRVPVGQPVSPLPDGLTLCPAPPEADLVAALRLSYVDTLDCPGLNGLRSIEDIIAGYRNAHPYDPTLWHVLYDASKPIGVLLLSQPGPGEMLELSYLGLATTGRHRGLGKLLLRHACHAAARAGSAELAVTVDSQNRPAKALYFRAGGQVVMRRHVMLRSICSGKQH